LTRKKKIYIGGSTASWSWDGDAQCGVFEGVLDLTPPPGANHLGFAALVSLGTLGPWNLEDFDGVSLNVRTDDRMYVTNIKASSVIEGDLWQAYTLGSTPGKWEDIVLPFSKFVLTQRGFVVRSSLGIFWACSLSDCVALFLRRVSLYWMRVVLKVLVSSWRSARLVLFAWRSAPLVRSIRLFFRESDGPESMKSNDDGLLQVHGDKRNMATAPSNSATKKVGFLLK
jgi:hypothetical protein